MQIADRFKKPLQIRRILIIQLGDIGDVVWSLPAVQAVRAAYPGAAVSLLVREGSGSLLAVMDLPPGIFEVRKGGGGLSERLRASLRLVRDLRRERFDLVFDLRGDERGGYMAFLSGAPVRAAQHYHDLPLLRNRMFTHLVHNRELPPGANPVANAADSSLLILQAFGIISKTTVPELRLSRDVVSRAVRILADEGVLSSAEAAARDEDGGGMVLERWVSVNPFSRWAYKEWGMEKWAQIIDWLGEECGIATMIVGSPDERERADRLAFSCGGQVRNLTGRTTLAELAGVLSLSRLHIGVDSAAPHIAAAVGTPTVTLYGPSDWRYWAPPGPGHRVVVSDMPCVPCRLKGCDGGGVSRCLDNLRVEDVQAVIREALALRTSQDS